MIRDAVLVIDDDPDFREVMGLTLESLGMVALFSHDCFSGLGVLEREHGRIRAVLLDYWMPGLPPRECGVRVTKWARDIPVILVTAAPDAAGRAAELGCKQWLAKPFTPEALKRALP